MTLANRFIKRVAPRLSQAIGYLRAGTAYLTPKDDWVEGLRRRLALLANPIAEPLGRPLVRAKGDADYFASTPVCPDAVEEAIYPLYQRNLTSTRKYRIMDSKKQWAVGSWVYDPEDTDWQHHVYLFANPDGGTDLYGHKETSAEKDPYGHVTEKQIHGDPDGIVREKLNEASITYD